MNSYSSTYWEEGDVQQAHASHGYMPVVSLGQFPPNPPEPARHVPVSMSETTHIKRHTATHHCPFCARAFSRRHDLDRHTRVHTGLKPYICPCCFRSFARSDARRRHFRSEEACQHGLHLLNILGEKRVCQGNICI